MYKIPNKVGMSTLLGILYLLLTYLLVLKERGFLDASQQPATEVVLQSLYVRLESPNALWRLFWFVRK